MKCHLTELHRCPLVSTMDCPSGIGDLNPYSSDPKHRTVLPQLILVPGVEWIILLVPIVVLPWIEVYRPVLVSSPYAFSSIIMLIKETDARPNFRQQSGVSSGGLGGAFIGRDMFSSPRKLSQHAPHGHKADQFKQLLHLPVVNRTLVP